MYKTLLKRGRNKKQVKFKLKAFTLAEVLITLVIIGIISAITVPTLNQQYKWQQYKSAAKKAQSMLGQAISKFQYQEGYTPLCGYWGAGNNPYGSATCGSYDADGNCTQYVLESTGENIPYDYNGPTTDCIKLYKSFLNNLNIQKVCDKNAYDNGCIPKYEGVDTIYASKNTDSSAEEVNNAVSGIQGFKQATMLNGKAFVTNDGMVFFPI